MGVVRREGNWRLEKRDEGVYVVTHQKQPETKIITSDYQPAGFNDERNDFTIPVREVASFSDAEELFQDMANGKQQTGFTGFEPSIPQGGTNGIDTSIEPVEDGETPDLPRGGVLVIGLVGGGIALQQGGFNLGSPVSLLGIGLLAIGVIFIGLTYRVYATEGLSPAMEYLLTVEDEDTGSSEQQAEPSPEKTPPAPKSMKEEIYFERAGQKCEWCEERTDSPEVHHIEPRSEGGPNEYDNLIALCPTCHSKADKGGISKTKLRSKTSRQMDQWSKEV